MAIYNPDAPRRLPLSRREKLIRAVGAIVLLFFLLSRDSPASFLFHPVPSSYCTVLEKCP